MIKQFIDIFQDNKNVIIDNYKKEKPGSYADIFNDLISLLNNKLQESDDEKPDPKRITVIDHGHYQGNMLFIVGGDRYQTDRYWWCSVDYGSCSGCDTFEAISGGEESMAKDYAGLMLNMAQSLRELLRD